METHKVPVRIGFIVLTSNRWFGGVSYYRNLLYAISKTKSKNIQPILFVGTDVGTRTLKDLKKIGVIVKTDLLNINTFLGKINTTLMSLFCSSFLMLNLFKKNHIEVVSHSNFITSNKHLKTINWIPDFQHLYMPEMFSKTDRLYRSYYYGLLAKYSDLVILISHTEYLKFCKIYPEYINKARVLRFTSSVDKEVYVKSSIGTLQKKYKFSGKYFFFPAQLWRHKNHMVVLKALNSLKKENKNILVVSSGYLNDYRNNKYSKEIFKFVKANNLTTNIKFLGPIDYGDVQKLERNSISIINPSFYEGWSTSVEEAKSLGKDIILSDIEVHHEQNPPGSIFFNPNDDKSLAKILWNMWKNNSGGPNKRLELISRNNIDKRIVSYGKEYEKLAISLRNVIN